MFPPYGKQLYAERLRGKHPDLVAVKYSAQWFMPPDDSPIPIIMVPAKDYQRGAYDFSFLAGLLVRLYVDTFEDSVLELAAEIGGYASYLIVEFCDDDREGFRERELSELLYCHRYFDKAEKRMTWPAGWSDQLDLDYRRRMDLYLQFTQGDRATHE